MIAQLARKARAAFDVVEATVAVARSRRIVARRPIGSLVGRAELPVPSPDATGPSPTLRRAADRWAAAVDRALRWVPGDTACLVRASALRELLARHGVPGAVVRIGVRRGERGFEAHAWVEEGGTPIAEPEGLRGAFSSLDGVTLR